MGVKKRTRTKKRMTEKGARMTKKERARMTTRWIMIVIRE
jgi:hypothetical protein